MKFNHAVVVAAAFVLTGCVTRPEPLSQAQILAFSSDKLARSTANQEPIGGPVSLYEAMARALKYNLDSKVETMEAALRIRELDLASFSLLPELVASSGYLGRSEGEPTLASLRDEESVEADLTFSWNILDFGLAYVRSKQLADKALIQEEMKRKVVNRTIEDVRTAYWRAVSYERLVDRMRALEGRVNKALRNTRTLASGGETSPLVALTYERELIQVQREIEKLEGELRVAKSQLAALMNVRPGTDFNLKVPEHRSPDLDIPGGLEQLYTIAAANRPEMREIAYELRINSKEVNAALLELLPSFNVYAGANYDSNEFIATNDWVSWGARASWNVLKLASMPATFRRVEAKETLLEQRALSVAMAIMTQIHISRLRFAHLEDAYDTATSLSDVQHRILRQIRAETSAERTSEQILIREEMNTLVADAERDMAYADLQNAYANVYASLGVDPFPIGLNSELGVDAMADQLRALWQRRGAGPDLTVASAN